MSVGQAQRVLKPESVIADDTYDVTPIVSKVCIALNVAVYQHDAVETKYATERVLTEKIRPAL
jgi:hypothetical protein